MKISAGSDNSQQGCLAGQSNYPNRVSLPSNPPGSSEWEQTTHWQIRIMKMAIVGYTREMSLYSELLIDHPGFLTTSD